MIPEILTGAGEMLARYDVALCDIWGVVHDGIRAHAGANDALSRFRAGGGTVVLVSNAPVPAPAIADLLDAKGVVRTAWDAIVSSGDLALSHIAEKGYARLHRIGPPDRDAALFASLPGPDAKLADADAIVCSGLFDDRREEPRDYTSLLAAARSRDLPFVCANPDLVVDVGQVRLPCAGSLAAIYQDELRGDVFWAGKPHAIAYATAISRAETIRGRATDRRRIIGIGDAVRTDLAAAAGAGIDALFVTSGLHREDVMEGGAIDTARLTRLFSNGGPSAAAAIAMLRW